MSDGSLKAKLQDAMKDAMRSKAKERLGVIRLMNAAIKQKEVDERIELDDTQVLAVLDKMVKQRRESISQFQDAGRDDLVAKESAEIDVISEFMPEPLSEAEIDQAISDALTQTGANSMKDMGKVMGVLQGKLKGRADMSAVSAKIKSRLAG
ncbi:MAG: GatB/YqeY domain-containing protein [Gammaproteobacteria bacterium]|nr:GatB/YqeY domain-containing protein [Gammaproteobacteria bacterium]MDH5691664.1 GatB/YqeY domain-containing protein [Gammaproteobacteria bacterium]